MFKPNGEKNLTFWLLIAIAALLVVSNIVTIYVLYYKNQSSDVNVVVDFDKDGLSDALEREKYGTDPNNLDTDGDGYSDGEEIKAGYDPLVPAEKKLAANEIKVDWQETPTKIENNAFFSGKVFDDFAKKTWVGDMLPQKTDFLQYSNVYKLGDVSSGKYAGKEIFYVSCMSLEGPTPPNNARVIKDGDNFIFLSKNSNEVSASGCAGFFTEDKETAIFGLDNLPDKIKIANTEFSLIKEKEESQIVLLADNLNYKKLFEYESGKYVYRDKNNGCIFAVANDGSIRRYYYDPGFIDLKDESAIFGPAMPVKMDIVWSNNTQNQDEYYSKMTKCGGLWSCYEYADYIKSIDQLEKVGESENGYPIYAPKNDDLKRSPESPSGVLKESYDMYYPGFNEKTQKEKAKVSYEEYVGDHPIIYWQDPFGDFIEFKSGKYLPGVECGKPVIYLYPEKKMDVSVEVNPTGGFKFTEPSYNGGWKVLANPDGQIYNYADKKIYPYLFWEGYGLNYERPKEGFVVAKKEIKPFLYEKLLKLGLIKNEIDEFVEFWLPRMQNQNYYFVTFVPQNQFDYLAPLKVNPKPGTVIRVFMDYEGLARPIKVSEPKIITPVRRGFTVVEWGGAMR